MNYWPQQPTPRPDLVGEVRIYGIIGQLERMRACPRINYMFKLYRRQPTEADFLSAAAVKSAIDRSRELGARALLVHVDSCSGGDTDESHAICKMLRDFSRQVGRVVSYVTGFCGSSSPEIALSADYVVVDPQARLSTHGAIASDPSFAARAAEEDRRALDFFLEHTITPLDVLEKLVTRKTTGEHMADWLTAETVYRWGWADMLAPREAAFALAARLTDASWAYRTARQDAIAARRAQLAQRSA